MHEATATDERGQTMAEYVVTLGVITVVIMATFGVLSGTINGFILGIVDGLTQ
jgi:Flp pilus assembly pilin Flp